MMPTTVLTMVDGVRIAVPDSLELITPYVLREQGDWFEDEIKFLRRILRPGQRVIDVGANYGVYSLSMARAVGPGGRVWAFEPASHTAGLLAESIALNGFAHITLEAKALSDRQGYASLLLNQNAELNTLDHGGGHGGASETVPVATLDDGLESYGWRDIDFLKIDAEGEEANILRGGQRFFSSLSPLVQYEVKAGAELHLGLVQAFAALGYASYRLVPGLDLLVPFDAQSRPDGYLLNLFCCKPDRAAQLAAQGALLESGTAHPLSSREWAENFLATAGNPGAFHWRHRLAQFPYGVQLAPLWEQTASSGGCSEVDAALAFYAASREASLSPQERFAALAASFDRFSALCERQPFYLRLASLARVAKDYGARELAVNALGRLSSALWQNQGGVDFREPFLAPGAHYDRLPLGQSPGNWILSAVLEELERQGHFSSFYSGMAARQRLQTLGDLGYCSQEMQRRLTLLRQRFDVPVDRGKEGWLGRWLRGWLRLP